MKQQLNHEENNKDKNMKKLEAYKSIVRGIAATFGDACEVVLHDLTHPESSIVMIEGNITGRKIGSPLTNIGLEVLRKYEDNAEDILCYQSKTKDGRTLKSSTMFIKDDEGKIIGCLCINIDLTDCLYFKNIVEKFCLTEEIGSNKQTEKSEFFGQDINEVLEEIIKGVLKSVNTPVPMMEKEEKIAVVNALDEKGVFLVKGAIDHVATFLGVSRYTIYNYLEEARSKRGSPLI
ncbi:MAG: PAS domain-containing protein [Bacillota bacterium]